MNGKFALTDAILAMSMVLPPPTATTKFLSEARLATRSTSSIEAEPTMTTSAGNSSPRMSASCRPNEHVCCPQTINPIPSSLSSVRTLAVSRIASCSITTILGSCIHCFIGDHLAVDLGNFIYQYYINPIIYDTGYNPVNTITWAIILGLSLFGVVKLLDKLDITVDEIFIFAVSPYIFVGGSLRVVEDAGIVAAPLKYLLITPLIYFFIFFVCVAILILSKGLERVSRIKYYWPFALGGVAWSIVNIWLLYTTAKSFNATIFVLILSVGAALSFLVFVVARLLNFTLLKDRVNAFVLDGQLLDATATSFGLTFLPYAEKHVLPNFLIEATGTAFVMYPLKLIVTIPVLFIIDEYLKGESRNLIGIVKLAILTVGLAPAIRDTLRMSLGI